MTRKGMKRLDLWLPENHPVFKYPPGSRVKVARQWLDLGARLSGVEKKLTELEEKLNNISLQEFTNNEDQRDKEKGRLVSSPPFNVDAFAKTLTDIFG
ncbi:MAG: hypothetical protein HPY58_14280 [Firmicutes bacterium]|nr:hypothetical protein [Bacillota bacterium]